MRNTKQPTTAQLRDDIDNGRTGTKVAAPDPAAAPLGTDDEAAGSGPSGERVEIARRAERRIDDAAARDKASRTSVTDATDQAHAQRGSSAPYAKEDHMNEELLKQVERGRSANDPPE